IPVVEVEKGYVSTRSQAPVMNSLWTPLAGGKVTVGYDESAIQLDGYFKVDLSKLYTGYQIAKIFDSSGNLLATYKINVSNRQTLTHKIELTGSQNNYYPQLYSLDTRGNIVKEALPRAWAGPDKIVLTTRPFSIQGRGYDWDSSDNTEYEAGHNDVMKYEWDYYGDDKYDYASNTSGLIEFGTGELAAGNYTFTLRVTDRQRNVGFDTMDLRVVAAGTPNTQPVAHAGYDQTVEELDLVSLDGTRSYDDDGDAITYQWYQTAGPVVSLSSYTSAVPTFTADLKGTYVFALQVDDGTNSSISKSEYDFVNIFAETRESSATPDLVYHSNADASGYYFLYTMNGQGGNIEKLPTFSLAHSMNPVFSRAGESVFFESSYGGRGQQIFNVHLTTGALTTLTAQYDNYSPAVSPTAEYLAFVSTRTGDQQIFITDTSGNAPDTSTQRVPHQLMVQSGVNQCHPCFTADGNSVVFSSDSDEIALGYGDIYLLPLTLLTGETTHDPSRAVRLTDSTDDEHSPHCSIMNEIVYIRKRAGINEIWKMQQDGTEQEALLTGYDCRNPRFKKDGQTIVFTAMLGGDSDYELYTMTSSGSGISVMTSNSADDCHGDFHP
ncbi:MAG: PKD domain-containing protein, partial [Candidatus Wallbacteria bacterium]|nr:PKD domain-containing protein [Candidatus Wallbacteria bacterium]